VVGSLDAAFSAPLLSLPGTEQRRLLRRLASLGISGGAVYDARVAAVALDAGLPLATLDRRAFPVYQAVGAQVRLLT
jgi:predicted nucleic acid-binding protein